MLGNLCVCNSVGCSELLQLPICFFQRKRKIKLYMKAKASRSLSLSHWSHAALHMAQLTLSPVKKMYLLVQFTAVFSMQVLIEKVDCTLVF